MGWRPEERSSSDVGQWTTLLRRLLGHFAISTTSVECYGLSHACFYLRLSSNVTTRVWIDNLYHIKPGKYHGVGTLSPVYILTISPRFPVAPRVFIQRLRSRLLIRRIAFRRRCVNTHGATANRGKIVSMYAGLYTWTIESI